MKPLFTTLFATLSFFGYAQEKDFKKVAPFVLNGKLTGRDSGVIVLTYVDSVGKYMRDTAILKNGLFVFKGYIRDPNYAHLIGSSAEGNYASFFLEGSNQQIQLKENEFYDLKMQGSKTQAEYDGLLQAQKPMNDRIRALEKERNSVGKLFKIEKDSLQQKIILAKLDAISAQQKPLLSRSAEMEVDFILHHPASFASATLLYGHLLNTHSFSTDTVALLYKAFDAFTPAVKASKAGVLAEELIAKYKATNAPDFTVTDINGKPLSLSSFKGKYVLLDFWASWCIPCRESTPYLKTLYQQYHQKGFEIVAIADDDKNPDAWRKAVAKDGTNIWYNALSGLIITNSGWDKTDYLNEKFGVQALPTKILIDTNGKIVGRFTSTEEDKMLGAKLAEIFK